MRNLLLLLLGGCAHGPAALEAQLESEITALRLRASFAEDQARACDPTPTTNPLYEELRQVFADTPVQVVRADPATVLLPPWSEVLDERLELSERGGLLVDLAATAAAIHEDVQLRIQVSSPPVGRETSAEAGLVKAVSAARQLYVRARKRGVPAERLWMDAQGLAVPEEGTMPRPEVRLVLEPTPEG